MIHLNPRAFRIPLTDKQKSQLRGIGDIFDDDFSDLIYRLNPEGRKVLIISDHAGSEPAAGAIFSGEERTVFHNIVRYTLGQCENKISDLYFVSWPRAFVDPGRGNVDDKRRMSIADQVFLGRMQYIIGKLKPDAIAVCGSRPFGVMYRHFGGVGRPAYNMNRVLKAKVYGHTFDYLGTADIFRPCSYDPKFRNFGQLIGWISKGLRQVIDGKPDYTVETNGTQFVYINTIQKFNAFYKELCAAKIVASDTEGEGLGRISSKLYCLQYAFEGKKGYLIPLDHWDTPFTADELNYIRKKLRDYYERGTSHFHIWQFAKYDIGQLYANLGIRYYNHRVYDTMAGRWALDENLKALKIFGVKPNSLEYMTEADYNNDVYQRIEFSKGDRNKIGQEGFTRRLIEYGVYDATIIFQICQFQRHEAKVTGYNKFLRFVTTQMGDKIIVLAQMEFVGAPVDKRQVYRLAAQDGPVAKTIELMEQKFRNSPRAQMVNEYLLKLTARNKGDMFGQKAWLFNLSQTKHKQLLFFKANKLEPLSLNQDGTGAINKAFIARYIEENEDVHAFAEWTKARTIKNSFVEPILKKIQSNPDTLIDQRVRSFYTYTEVVGGRLSSTDPNLQNIPNRDDKTFKEAFAKQLKAAFIAEMFCMLEDADFSANEVRDWANEAKDTVLGESFYQGMKMRRQLRIHSYENEEEYKSWLAYKKETGFDKIEKPKEINGKTISVHAQKMALIGKINNPVTQEFGTIELALSLGGDLHYVNASVAFQVNVLEVTKEQRHNIKSIVFGRIYGKIAASFAKSKAEGGLGLSEEECQAIMDRLFSKFVNGKKWLDGVQEFGQKNLFVESPLGMRRHLWAYLHSRPAFINAMNRRAGNAIIQGTASEIGVTTMRMLQWLFWHFFTKYGVNVYWKSVNNYVHDATKSHVPIPFLPVYIYLREHASTTLVHKYYKQKFDYNLIIGIEGESTIGANLARCQKWDYTTTSLVEMMREEIQFQRDTLGYEYTPKQLDRMMRGLVHNGKIVSKLRLEELKFEYDNDRRVASKMLMTEQNARSLGIYTGMEFISKH